MQTGAQYIGVIVAGLAAIAWGLPASHRLKPPFDILAACAVLAGVVATSLGVLLLIIPDFFR